MRVPVGVRAEQRVEMAGGGGGGQEPAAGEGQGLTAAGVVPPADQGGARLLADDGVPAEDLATQLLLLYGVPGGTQIRHTVPGGMAGTVGCYQRWGGKETQPHRRGPGSPTRQCACVCVCVRETRYQGHRGNCAQQRADQRTGPRTWRKAIPTCPGSPTHSRKGSGATSW